MNKQFWLMDGRANYSIDNACVLETCNTFQEAMNSLALYGNDTCIVKVEGDKKELVYSLLQEHNE